MLSFMISEAVTANAPIQAMQVDAVAELWFDDVAAMQRAGARPEMQAVLANGAKYLGMIKPFVTEEVEII